MNVSRIKLVFPLSLLLISSEGWLHSFSAWATPQPSHQSLHPSRSVFWSRPVSFWSQAKNDDDAPPQVAGRSAGSRGCMAEAKASDTTLPALMLLAPIDAIAQTQSSRPTIAWHLREQSTHPLTFRLYEASDTAQLNLLYEATLSAQSTQPSRSSDPYPATDTAVESYPAGVSVLDFAALPQLPELSPGGSYIWQVEMVCDPRRPSGNLFAQAPLRVLPLKGSSSQSTAPQNPPLPGSTPIQTQTETVNILLEQQRWQDALTVILRNSEEKLDTSGALLLESVVLNRDELQHLQAAPLHHAIPQI